ncbi:hypothetical protein KFL_001860240 [Klebsormidium nitens]|uniref:Cytochrome b561 and DOMON domain-containing protein n=1 Tax=Klebsormidium nitens TaxID=105231 RepID=A0A1Y1I6M7_KLENI|nr:hypothetical protein KFL_001860240 [Klebsormidium nitens]|eukprot:GAQ84377.1 hypothetical protein KFL_001860240 [Klebsormidium nitens]
MGRAISKARTLSPLLPFFVFAVLASLAALDSTQAASAENNTSIHGTDSGATLTSKNASCEQSPFAGYDCVLTVVPGQFEIHWALDGELLYIAAVATTTGWVAVGWSPTGQMVGSNAVIGPDPNPVGGFEIQAFRLGGRSVSRVHPNPNITVLFASSVTMEGVTRLEFARLVNESGPGIVPVVAAKGVPNRMLWAVSPDGSTGLQYHGPTNRMPFSVDFVSGASARALIDDEAHYRHLASKMRAHGWLMGFGVGVLLPLGALASRFGKNRLPHWFYLHAVCQITGVILMTIGAIIAFSYFDALQRAQSHAQARQHSIGLTIFILAWVQLLIALFRPSPGTRIRRIWFLWHWFLGTGIIIMGGVNVFLGMALFHKYTDYGIQGARVVYAIFVSFYALVYLALDTFLKPAPDAAERARIQLSTFPNPAPQYPDSRPDAAAVPPSGAGFV